MPMSERTTSGLTWNVAPLDRRRRVVLERFAVLVVLVERPLRATYTSTTTGKTIGRRFVCSYR
jgi:hypothetical protein